MRRLGLGSLRARLLVGLVVLAAVGLTLAGYITYSEERSFLLGQVDAQVIDSFNTVEAQVDESNRLRSVGEPKVGGTYSRSVANAPLGGDYGAPLEHQIDPAGTFGEHVKRSGQRVGKPVAYDFKSEYAPKLPHDLASYVSTPGHTHLFTVRATGDKNVSYRLMVQAANVGYGYTVVGLSLANTNASLERLQTIEAVVIASVLVALALVAWVVIRIGLRPLDRIGVTARAIADGDLARRVSPANDRTEVGRLGLALNAMLGQIEQAFAKRQQSEDRLRRFLSDASHELRTPLTSIRGYAELLRRGAAASREEAGKATERIEQEAARMGILVEQLLALARLDELPGGRREPVDLVPLIREAGEDARAAAPEREITVKGARGAHVIEGDPDDLHKVLANLVTNALKHTPPGTAVELSLARHNGFERIEVRDHGPGLPAGGEETVFERFWRAQAGRERGKAGAGLGLAIAAEIIAGHGGRITAANARGGGASFVIELPSAFS
jgi:two-component system OmpR family sensor kinase